MCCVLCMVSDGLDWSLDHGYLFPHAIQTHIYHVVGSSSEVSERKIREVKGKDDEGVHASHRSPAKTASSNKRPGAGQPIGGAGGGDAGCSGLPVKGE